MGFQMSANEINKLFTFPVKRVSFISLFHCHLYVSALMRPCSHPMEQGQELCFILVISSSVSNCHCYNRSEKNHAKGTGSTLAFMALKEEHSCGVLPGANVLFLGKTPKGSIWSCWGLCASWYRGTQTGRNKQAN